MEIPESMKAELSAWNNGEGIDLESWIGCEGNFKLAVGYSTIFWPEFVMFDGYIFRKGFSETSVRGFESQPGSTRQSVERVMNHLHIEDIQHHDCFDVSSDKLISLGNVLKEIYEFKLKVQFPENPCRVEFYQPNDKEYLVDYQLSFWQIKHEAPIK